MGRATSATSASLRYDPLGRLYEVVGVEDLAHPSTTTTTTRFLYDGDALVAEYNTSGTLLRRYVHGPGAGDDPLVWFEGSGVSNAERRYLYADERGSIVAVTDSIGAVTSVNTYDEYGRPNGALDPISTRGRFRYTGQAYFPELGMYYYKARMYSPRLGRFMQTDPIGYGDGMNMYGYVHGDPVNGVDPSGLDCAIYTSGDGPGGRPEHVVGSDYSTCPPAPYDWMHQFDTGVNFAPAANSDGGGGGPAPEPPCPGPHRPSSLDGTIRQEVANYNDIRGNRPQDAEYLNPLLIEAMVAVESGFDTNAYNNDPMQVNVPGDWVAAKGRLTSLTEGVAPGQLLGIRSGIQWLLYKAFHYDSSGNATTFKGWFGVARDYNGGGNPNYLRQVRVAMSAIIRGC